MDYASSVHRCAGGRKRGLGGLFRVCAQRYDVGVRSFARLGGSNTNGYLFPADKWKRPRVDASPPGPNSDGCLMGRVNPVFCYNLRRVT